MPEIGDGTPASETLGAILSTTSTRAADAASFPITSVAIARTWYSPSLAGVAVVRRKGASPSLPSACQAPALSARPSKRTCATPLCASLAEATRVMLAAATNVESPGASSATSGAPLSTFTTRVAGSERLPTLSTDTAVSTSGPSAALVVSSVALPSAELTAPTGRVSESEPMPDRPSLPLALMATVPRSHWPAAGALQAAVGRTES